MAAAGNLRAASADKQDMVIAQAVGEYAGASTAIETVSHAWMTVYDQVSEVSSTTWIIAGVVVAVLYFLWGRK